MISFSVPAEIIAMSGNDTVSVQEAALLTCVGHGVPTPNIRWEKNGVNLLNSSLVSNA